MQPLCTTAEIRAIEEAHGTQGLMERAGLAAAELAADIAEAGRPILVLAGPGNNGGDALVAARHLKYRWHAVELVFSGDAGRLQPDARAALDAWLACGGTLRAEIPPGRDYGLIIDGLFGIGLKRSLDARHADLVERINTLPAPVLALDLPSGLEADSGRALGPAVVADHTLTFIAGKPGLYTLDGPDHAGVVHVCDLGLPVPQGAGTLLDAPPTLPAPRRRNSHKGSHGSVGVLGGDTGMCGAVLLSARAALLAGAGRVYCGLLAEDAPLLDPGQPELMLRSDRALADIDHLTALAVGPGLGRTGHAATALRRALHYPAPLLLDADALHLLGEPELRRLALARDAATLLTPHPGEAAALLGCSTAEIQADRIAAACRIARDYRAVTVLKGCGSVIAAPDGHWWINASGNPGLASAGTGDVLAGLVAALAAQGLEPLAAMLLGVHLHGAAADALVARGHGPLGLTAGEVAAAARDLLNRWIGESH